MNFHALIEQTPRLLIQADLQPLQGSRFQPTGFPDLGAAVFQTPGGDCLLVESVQSMANRMEVVCWDSAQNQLVPALRGLSYVRVEQDGAYLTSSIQEAHRLNSPYILESHDKTFFEALRDQTSAFADRPIDYRQLARIVLRYDASSLLHGVFLAKKELAGGRLRIPRALSGFIEAQGVRVAASGGVKIDHVNPQGDTSKGFGHVPFQRDEYTADAITAYFNLDLIQIRGYGLPQPAENLLIALALFKIRSVLHAGLRLRTACDLELRGPIRVTRPQSYELPDLTELTQALPDLIAACAEHFAGERGITRVTYQASSDKSKQKAKK